MAVAPTDAPAQADNRNAQSTRAQIEQALTEAQKILASPGYSGRIKDAKRREISLLKSRLEDGDLQPGDQVALDVMGEQTLSQAFVVSSARTLTLPGLDPLSLKGVLRAEMLDVVTAHLRRYVKDPVVKVKTTVRLSFLGGIGKPGFYQIASDFLLGDALMAAGGPSGGTDPAKTRVERSGNEIMSKESFQQAIIDGKTLDQLNLRAGDEFLVGGNRTAGQRGANLLTTVVPVLSAVMSLGYLATRFF